jgi:hypothetical protein
VVPHLAGALVKGVADSGCALHLLQRAEISRLYFHGHRAVVHRIVDISRPGDPAGSEANIERLVGYEHMQVLLDFVRSSAEIECRHRTGPGIVVTDHDLDVGMDPGSEHVVNVEVDTARRTAQAFAVEPGRDDLAARDVQIALELGDALLGPSGCTSCPGDVCCDRQQHANSFLKRATTLPT